MYLGPALSIVEILIMRYKKEEKLAKFVAKFLKYVFTLLYEFEKEKKTLEIES